MDAIKKIVDYVDNKHYLGRSDGMGAYVEIINSEDLQLFADRKLKLMSVGEVFISGGETRITDVVTPENNTDAVNKEYVDNKVGNIEEALDGIIAIQEELIGGGSV